MSSLRSPVSATRRAGCHAFRERNSEGPSAREFAVGVRPAHGRVRDRSPVDCQSIGCRSCATRRCWIGWDERAHRAVRRSGPSEAGGSLTSEARVRAGAAPTTTRRVGTARRSGLGKRGREAKRAVNQWWNPLKASSRLQSGGSGPSRQRTHARGVGQRLRRSANRVGWEATGKVCGVLVARLSGEKLVADPADRSTVNVGTIRCRPISPLAGGQARRRLTASGWGGAFVVVCGRESRLHGEGRQQVCGIRLEGEEVVVE